MTKLIKSLPASLAKKLAFVAMAGACAIAVAAITASAPSSQAYAEVIDSNQNWTVTFTSGEKMESNFDSGDITEFVGTMQPGDTANVSVKLKNEYSKETDWYMTNKVISSLEESAASANGGSYTYNLIYIAPSGSRTTLFSSDTVGGDNAAGSDSGLHEATGALADYFLLGSIATGQTAQVDLSVSLDGETQGNAYQNTLADLALDFAVEPTDDPGNTTTTPGTPNTGRLQQTGDQNLPIIALCGAAACIGLVLLIIAIVGRRKRNAEEGEVQ